MLGYELPELEPGVSLGDLPYLFQELDLSDPANPKVVDELPETNGPPGPYQSITASGDDLYFLNYFEVVYIQ